MPENLQIKTARGVKIFYCEVHPDEQKKKGILIISHGYGEHSGYYRELMQFLANHGYGSYALDHCGHGLSEEERGHLERFELFVEDLDQFVDYVRMKHPQLPISMYGHSMGGLIAFHYGIQFPEKLQGQIFTGPAIGRPVGTALIPGFLFEILNKYFHRYKIYQVLSHRATRNLEVRKKSNEDPLVLKYATIGFFYEFVYRGVNEAMKKAEQYRLPCLFLHGKADRIIPYQSTPFIFEKISSRDKELKLYEGLYHELIQEPERDMVLGDILNWLEKRVK
ncbi:lysophospholipase [Desulfitobacterium sp. AusDCA]|uniref:alpha/beta hydrolase n=1 Tax=Desulfitobacterium sp. AusDCA TaxID=3240383 RepID=UPI003DA7200C